MRPELAFLPLFLALGACCAHTDARPRGAAERDAAAVLDRLHRLAAEADGAAYFGLFTPDAVFIGTDATERWSVEQFRAYAEPHFARGQGWTYTVTQRHLFASHDGRTVWFDERLDNRSYGECRGSGVVVATGAGWRIAQYVLSLPVPNELASELVERIRTMDADAGRGAGGGGL